MNFEVHQKLLPITSDIQTSENAEKRTIFFSNIFLVDEEGLCIRLGICNLIEHVKQVRNAYKNVISQFDLAIKRKSIHNCVKKSIISTISVPKAISIQANEPFKAVIDELMRSWYSEIKTFNEKKNIFFRESLLSATMNLPQAHHEEIGHKGRNYRRSSRSSKVSRQRQKPYTRSKVNDRSDMNFEGIIVPINNAIEEKLMDINRSLKSSASSMIEFSFHQFKTTELRYINICLFCFVCWG